MGTSTDRPAGRVARPTSTEQRSEVELRLGAGLTTLLGRTSAWTLRKSERVEFVNERDALRQVRIAFEYPLGEPSVLSMLDAGYAPVPLGWVPKDGMKTSFAATDQDGRSLAVWSRSRREEACGMCLEAAYMAMIAFLVADKRERGEDGSPWVDLPHNELRAAIGAVGRLRASDAVWLSRHLRNDALAADPSWRSTTIENWRVLDRWVTSDPGDAAAAARATCSPYAHALAPVLCAGFVQWLVCALAVDVPVLISLDPDAVRVRPAGLVQYQYQERLEPPLLKPATRGQRIKGLVERTADRCRESLSLRAKVFRFETPRIGQAAAHGFVVAAPPGVQIVFGRLTGKIRSWDPPPRVGWVRRGASAAKRAAGANRTSGKPARAPLTEAALAAYRPDSLDAASRAPGAGFWADVGWSSSRVTFEVDPADDEQYAGDITVELQASRDGLLNAAPLLCLTISVVLMVAKGHLSDISTHTGEDVVGGLLVGVPAVLAVAVVRSGEHPLATSMLRGIRLVTTLVGVASLIAATSLAHGLEGDPIPEKGLVVEHADHLIWTFAAWGATTLTALLMLCLLVNIGRTRRAPDTAPLTEPDVLLR